MERAGNRRDDAVAPCRRIQRPCRLQIMIVVVSSQSADPSFCQYTRRACILSLLAAIFARLHSVIDITTHLQYLPSPPPHRLLPVRGESES